MEKDTLGSPEYFPQAPTSRTPPPPPEAAPHLLQVLPADEAIPVGIKVIEGRYQQVLLLQQGAVEGRSQELCVKENESITQNKDRIILAIEAVAAT